MESLEGEGTYDQIHFIHIKGIYDQMCFIRAWKSEIVHKILYWKSIKYLMVVLIVVDYE